MKKLITNLTGGAPLTLDFLGFMDAKMNDIMNGLTSSAQSCILSGCVLTQGITNWQISSGWMVLEGEICKVIGGDTGIAKTETTNAIYWNITEVAVNPSPDVYEDLVPNNDTFERTASLTLAPVGFVPSYAQTPYYWQLVANTLNPINWVAVPAFNADWTASVRYRVDLMGNVTIQGNGTPSAGAGVVLFTLPAGQNLRPDNDLLISIVKVSGSGAVTADYAWVRANGNVEVSAIVVGCEYILNLPVYNGVN